MNMASNKKNTRPFTLVYNDIFLSLSTAYEKAMYHALKMHTDSKGQCFPSVKTLAEESGMGLGKANATLKDLEKKGVIKIEHQYLENGGKTSNLYTICDPFITSEESKKPKEKPKLKVQQDDVPEFEALTAKQKKEVSAADQADQSKKSTGDTSNDITTLRLHNNTLLGDSQGENRVVQTKYSMDELKKQYDYAAMVAEKPEKQASIDICIDIITTTVNSKKDTIRIQKEEIQREKVVGRFLKLTKEDIFWVIKRFEQQPNQIHSPKAYLLTLLYDAKNQRILDCQNRQAVAAAAAAPPQTQPLRGVAKGTEQFRNFTERKNNNYMAKILGQYSLPPEDQAADAGEESAP
jgi:GntR family transcriptional regulator